MPYFFCFPLFPRQDTGYWLLIKVAIKYAFILPALEWLIVGQLRRLLQGGPGSGSGCGCVGCAIGLWLSRSSMESQRIRVPLLARPLCCGLNEEISIGQLARVGNLRYLCGFNLAMGNIIKNCDSHKFCFGFLSRRR